MVCLNISEFILHADRFHRRELQDTRAKVKMGIKVNIWNREKNRRLYSDEIRCVQIYLDIFRHSEHVFLLLSR